MRHTQRAMADKRTYHSSATRASSELKLPVVRRVHLRPYEKLLGRIGAPVDRYLERARLPIRMGLVEGIDLVRVFAVPRYSATPGFGASMYRLQQATRIPPTSRALEYRADGEL